MIDFTTLRRNVQREPELDPIEIFQTLPKPADVNDLWDTQAAALRTWNNRRSDSDLVVKLNTGSGKTLVGLLIGESSRRELRMPVLYLAPTRQLVEQAVEHAAALGIPAESYKPGRGLPVTFENADSLLVATYHALFNGRSRFGLLGRGETVRIGAIILDDAHTSTSILRDIFSLEVTRELHEEMYRELAVRFRNAFEQVHAAGRLDDILAGREEGVMEVPYWAWYEAASSVREQIQGMPEDTFRFSLPLIRDGFEFCHTLISRGAFTITPILPFVHVIPSFSECERRVFMSATLADDGLLVRTFGADANSVGQPITTRSVAGLGERMILAPTLSGLTREQVLDAASDICDRVRADGNGAAVLVPSEAQAQVWAEAGDICIGDAVSEAVARLNDPGERARSLPILVNRYDGIDLPQDACRVLVLDGKPHGANAYDLYRASMLQGVSSITITLAQRVEQGMGRGTRGAGDYCVVLLLGRRLVEWLGRRDTQAVLTPGTRAQVELGREIAGHIASADDTREAARQCLDRDNGWKQIHAQRIADADKADRDDREQLIMAGRLERRAFELLLYQRPGQASDLLRASSDDHDWDDAYRGWLLQLGARYAMHAGDQDAAESIQADAHAAHRALLKPRGDVRYRRTRPKTAQAARVLEIIEDYAIRSAVLEGIDTALADLHAEASANRFEEGIRSLGRFAGLVSERPESSTGTGPDNLWLGLGDIGFVIECKHRKTTPVNKEDHGQMQVSLEWFGRHYDGWQVLPIVVHRDGSATPRSQAVDSELRAMTFDDLSRMKGALKAVYRELSFATATRDVLEGRAAALLQEHELEVERLVSAYTRSFTENSQR